MFRLGVTLQGLRPTTNKLVCKTANVRFSNDKLLQISEVYPPTLSCQARAMSAFNDPSGSELWKTMSGVSQQGKKRGRARNLLRAKDLNKGQRPGFGPAKINWPGLSSKVVEGVGRDEKKRAIGEMADKQYEGYVTKLDETRKSTNYKRGGKKFQHPLERGWTGGKPLGRKFGSPVSQNQDLKFENFQSVLLEFKTVFKMTGNLGRVRRNSVLMVTGNRNGAVGFTVSPGKYGNNQHSLKKSVNKAGLRLVHVERYEERTVYHDFFTQFGQSRIFVQQQPPGYGLRAHRAIVAICELVGIKDLYARVEGSNNIQHVVKAFFLGLLRQRTHQALADEKRLHLVEMRKENDYFPKVIASPSDGKVRTQEEIDHNEILDFEMISFEGHLPLWLPGQPGGEEKPNPHEKFPSWEKHLRRKWAYMDKDKVRMMMKVENGPEWGGVRSHYYPKYPECVERDWKKYIQMWKERKGESAD